MGQASACLAFSLPQEWEVWDEALVPWLRRQWSRRRYRRHTLAGRLGFLRRRGLVLLCRLGLMAGLLVWSGWSQCWPLSWALLSLPLAAALLSLLLLLWPRLLKVRVYPYLVRGVHDLYLPALMGLFSEGLLHLRDSPWSLLVGGRAGRRRYLGAG